MIRGMLRANRFAARPIYCKVCGKHLDTHIVVSRHNKRNGLPTLYSIVKFCERDAEGSTHTFWEMTFPPEEKEKYEWCIDD